jgi:CheY-like chemotaxis protein
MDQTNDERGKYMNADQWIKLSGILIAFLEAMSWPFIVLLALIVFRTPLKDFIENRGTIKIGPFEAEREKVAEIEDNLNNAAKEQKIDDQPSSSWNITKLANQVVSSQNSRQLNRARILWVDDHPENNTYQRNALEALGIRFTIATSTEAALKELRSKKFDAIISDLRRFSDLNAGYTLLDTIKTMDIDVPFIIYAGGGNREERKKEALKKGAFASVSGPQALFETVIRALEDQT